MMNGTKANPRRSGACAYQVADTVVADARQFERGRFTQIATLLF